MEMTQSSSCTPARGEDTTRCGRYGTFLPIQIELWILVRNTNCHDAPQHFEKQYPGANILMVTVTDEESRRIEQQDESTTKKEAMEVLRSMFGKDIPEATDILVPRWWSNKFFRGSFSNWPLGVNRHEFDSIKVMRAA